MCSTIVSAFLIFTVSILLTDPARSSSLTKIPSDSQLATIVVSPVASLNRSVVVQVIASLRKAVWLAVGSRFSVTPNQRRASEVSPLVMILLVVPAHFWGLFTIFDLFRAAIVHVIYLNLIITFSFIANRLKSTRVRPPCSSLALRVAGSSLYSQY